MARTKSKPAFKSKSAFRSPVPNDSNDTNATNDHTTPNHPTGHPNRDLFPEPHRRTRGSIESSDGGEKAKKLAEIKKSEEKILKATAKAPQIPSENLVVRLSELAIQGN